MSNFSFSYSNFKRLVLQTRKNQGLFGKGFNRDGLFLRLSQSFSMYVWEKKNDDTWVFFFT